MTFLHASLLVSDLEKALEFYGRVLGLEIYPERPDLGYPGAWFQIGEQQLHLLQLPNHDPLPAPSQGGPIHGGRDRHLAFSVDSLDEIKRRLAEENISFTVSKSGRDALFCRDPDANALEFVQANK